MKEENKLTKERLNKMIPKGKRLLQDHEIDVNNDFFKAGIECWNQRLDGTIDKRSHYGDSTGYRYLVDKKLPDLSEFIPVNTPDWASCVKIPNGWRSLLLSEIHEGNRLSESGIICRSLSYTGQGKINWSDAINYCGSDKTRFYIVPKDTPDLSRIVPVNKPLK